MMFFQSSKESHIHFLCYYFLQNNLKIACFFHPIFSILVFSGCVIEPDIDASNGYQISCDKGRDCIVIKDFQTIVVEPEVDKYALRKQYLIGHRLKQLEFSNANDSIIPTAAPPVIASNPGYFIIDTATGWSSLSLDEVRWLKELSRLGIKDSHLQNTPYDGTD